MAADATTLLLAWRQGDEAALDKPSKVVELKFFGGLETGKIAEVLEVSQQTVLRDWKGAEVWLPREWSRA